MHLNSLTLGEAKEELEEYLKEGREALLLNTACERLLARGKYRGFTARARFIVREDKQITLPMDFETLIAVTLDSSPVLLRDPWYEFVPRATAILGEDGLAARDLGDGFVTFRSGATNTAIRIIGEVDEEIDYTITGRRIEDEGPGAVAFQDSGTAPGDPGHVIPGVVTEITGFKKSRTEGRVFIEAQQPDSSWLRVACAEPRDTRVTLRRYSLPTAKEGDVVVGLCKRRFRKAEADKDVLAVDSIYALRMALEAVSYEEAGDPDTAARFWSLAVSHLDDALSEHRGPAKRTVPVYVRGAAGSKLRAIR